MNCQFAQTSSMTMTMQDGKYVAIGHSEATLETAWALAETRGTVQLWCDTTSGWVALYDLTTGEVAVADCYNNAHLNGYVGHWSAEVTYNDGIYTELEWDTLTK